MNTEHANGHHTEVSGATLTKLEEQASVARERLLEAIDALDHRTKNLRRGLPAVAIAIGGVAAVVGIGAFLLRKRQPKKPASWFAKRFQSPVKKPPTMARDVAQKVGTSVLIFALSEVGKLVVERTLSAVPRELPDHPPRLEQAP